MHLAAAGADAPVLASAAWLVPRAAAWLRPRATGTTLQIAVETPVQLAVLAFAAASSLLGLFVAALAFRALLRHRNRQMLFLGVGMTLLFGVAYGVGLAGSVLVHLRYLPMGAQDPFWLAVRVVQFVGLACVAYSLWIGRGASG